MRKILFALDDNHLSESAFAFVKSINDQERVHVTGVYIPSFVEDLRWTTPSGDAAFYVPRFIEEDETLISGNMTAFKEACARHHIHYHIQSDIGQSVLDGIRKETRFADLFVIGLDNYYQKGAEVFAVEECRQIIEHAECPVLLVPADAHFPEDIIVAYDGSADSVFALKMFTYIFPAMTEQHTLVVYANTHASELPEEEHIKELATRHFSSLAFSKLEFNPKKYFTTWMEAHPKAMLVAGAYGRSELSQLFKRSFINDLLEQHPVPVFIAHK